MSSKAKQGIGAGQRAFGAAAVFLGGVGLRWSDFATIWQPVPAELPGRQIFALLAALILVGAGMALQWRRGARAGAILLAALFLVFAALWARRVVGYPRIVATWAGTAEQLGPVIAGLMIWLSAQGRGRRVEMIEIGRALFGICAILFGLNHFAALKETAAMVPKWLPPSRMSWAVLTAIFDVLAGLAILSRIQAPLAARLLALMFTIFALLVWLPAVLAAPANHVAWAGTATTLVLAAAAWVVADTMGPQGRSGERRRS